MDEADESSPGSLQLTGERTIPGIPHENYWFRRHEAVYEWIAARWAGRLNAGAILEAGCGEGYGADLLSRRLSRAVIAVDYDLTACCHASVTYPSVTVLRANLAALPIRRASIELAVSLQVIEHLWNVTEFLHDVRASLTTGASVVISTPNRLTFSPGIDRGEKPINPFHVEEFDRDQLHDLLQASGFTDVTVFGLSHSRRLRDDDEQFGSLVQAQIEALTNGRWDDALQARVEAVTTDDFEVDLADDECLDLVAVGVRS